MHGPFYEKVCRAAARHELHRHLENNSTPVQGLAHASAASPRPLQVIAGDTFLLNELILE